jgi:hypothetical protein
MELRVGSPEILKREDGAIRFGAPVKIGTENRTAWFEVPESQEKRISLSSEPYLRALLPLASVEGYRLVFEQPLDPYSVYSCQRWLSMLQSWVPSDYKNVTIDAPSQTTEEPKEGETLFTYSGGIDSLYTVYRHHICTQWTPYTLNAAMLVLGLDIPLEETNHFEVVVKQAEQVMGPLGLGIVATKTNVKEFTKNYLYEYPAILAACFMAVGAGSRLGIIASAGNTGQAALSPGSTPFTDPQLGYPGFRIETGDWEIPKSEKMRGIAKWEAGRDNARVCYVNEEYSKNCGKCPKCINTMLCFKIFNGSIPASFHTELTPQIVRSIKINSPHKVKHAKQTYELAVKEDVADDPLFKALDSAIRKWTIIEKAKATRLGKYAKSVLRRA